jgi:hypothetical protein
MLARMQQNRNPYILMVGMQISTILWKAVWRFPKKLKIELPYDPVISVLGICAKEHKLGYSRDISALMFIAAPFTTAKLWKQPRCPTTDEWINKLWYIHSGVLLSHEE